MPMQIYDMLKTDHDAVRQLLNELVSTPEGDEFRTDLVEQIRDELIPHARAEEAVFYNSLRTMDEAKDKIRHSYREHMEAESLLRMLQLRDKMDLETKQTAEKLRDALEHHIQEEENTIFPIAQQLLTKDEAEKLGQAFERLKDEIRPEGFMKTTMEFIGNLLPARLKGTPLDRGAAQRS